MQLSTMAGRFCCAEDDRSDSPPLPNARLSPVRSQHSIPSAPFAPLGTGPRFATIRTTDLNDLRTIFENATTAQDDPKTTDCCDLRGLYASPHKAPLAPRRSVRQNLRRKGSTKGTSSSFTAFSMAKQKHQGLESSPHSTTLASQRRTTLGSLLGDRLAGDDGYDRDADEWRAPQSSGLGSNRLSPELNSRRPPKKGHRSIMRSFEWMSPLFDR